MNADTASTESKPADIVTGQLKAPETTAIDRSAAKAEATVEGGNNGRGRETPEPPRLKYPKLNLPGAEQPKPGRKKPVEAKAA